ncbi:MAG: response regulator transcription factor [Anaerolineales bacterium]
MKSKGSSHSKIRVAILDDHQSAVDSYTLRLAANKNIQVVGSAMYGNELDELLKNKKIDVLLLDIHVPNSEEDRGPYPVIYLLPRLRKAYPAMSILIVSMHDQRNLVKALLEAGASGYILKEDREAIIHLAEAVALVSTGGVYLSSKLRGLLSGSAEGGLLSRRQREALSLAAAYPNISTEEIGKRMNIAASTVRNLLSKAYKRLNVRNRSAATEQARKLGLISPFTDPSSAKPT